MTIFTWIIVSLSLIGTVLITFRRKEGFYFWIVGNGGLIFINYKAGIPGQIVLFSVYLVLAIYGVYKWRPKKDG